MLSVRRITRQSPRRRNEVGPPGFEPGPTAYESGSGSALLGIAHADSVPLVQQSTRAVPSRPSRAEAFRVGVPLFVPLSTQQARAPETSAPVALSPHSSSWTFPPTCWTSFTRSEGMSACEVSANDFG